MPQKVVKVAEFPFTKLQISGLRLPSLSLVSLSGVLNHDCKVFSKFLNYRTAAVVTGKLYSQSTAGAESSIRK